MSIPQTAQGRGQTYSEGASQGNLMLDIPLSKVDGGWPAVPTGSPGITAGAQMTLSVFGAVALGDPGVYQADPTVAGVTALMKIVQGGVEVFPATSLYVTYKLDGAGRIISVSGEGNDPTGHYFALLTTFQQPTFNGGSTMTILLVRSGTMQFSKQRA